MVSWCVAGEYLCLVEPLTGLAAYGCHSRARDRTAEYLTALAAAGGTRVVLGDKHGSQRNAALVCSEGGPTLTFIHAVVSVRAARL